jgi:gliding motility-associated-like protein
MCGNFRLKIIISLVLLLISNRTFSQLSQKHYIPPLTYAEQNSSLPNNQYIYISTPSNRNINYSIKPIGSSQEFTGVVSKLTPAVFFIGTGESQLFVGASSTSSVHNNKGYIIEASGGQIYVSVRIRAGGGNSQAGALVSKGNAALGKAFRAGMLDDANRGGDYLSFISLMATENNTKVNFSNLDSDIRIENSSSGSAIGEITLNEGESYILAANLSLQNSADISLIGTLISADKNIVVNVGSANGSFGPVAGRRDYGIDQIVDVNNIGTDYIFVRGNGEDGWENVLIVAHEDNTVITINGDNTSQITLLNAGDHTIIEGNNYSSNDNMFVQTTKPVFAYQGIGGLDNNRQPNEANQGMFFVPPLSCESRGNVDYIADIDKIGDADFPGGVTIVANRNATVTINNLSLNNYNTIGPNNVTGNSDYVTYKVTGLSGDISVESTEELYCAYFNQNGVATSGSFYSGFITSPEINFDTTVAALGNCIPNINLEAPNINVFDSFRWEYFNETTSSWETRGSESSYKPLENEPGRYRLVGKIDCKPEEEFISAEIPVSICPKDTDADFIIDNLDVDLDNDGILNCDESFGDVRINLSDIDNATAVNPKNSSNVINSSFFNRSQNSNSLSGDTSGNFTSTIVNEVSSESSYNLEFEDGVNVVFKQSESQSHVAVDGEYFVIKISPSSRNITLLDPDDQLLINTTFDLDQEFEEGITQKSASEIWFRYKNNINPGNSTFKFVANKIDAITFEHKSIGLLTNSTFNGNILLTCFARDSDNDGVEDAIDIDSDNDGIPDFFESVALDNVSLSDTDINQDGLNDIFDTVAPNQDTDNDGVPNYLDVDSDNDGIYDLIEAGLSPTLDSNNDGIIDSAISRSGTNGLYNPLETSSDSGNINYTINNSDTNTEVEANRDSLFDFVDLDSDGDDCFDVTEAGFTGSITGTLAPNALDVNTNGKVNNSDGYTAPNNNFITSAPIILNTPFENFVFCENTIDIISIDSNADRFLWLVSNDNGLNFTQINNDSNYTVNDNNLTITNVPVNFNNYIYKVILERDGNSCPKEETALLTVNPLPTPNPIAIINECSSNPNTATVNLSQAEINIITDPENHDFIYFISETDAINNNNPLTEEEYQTFALTVNVRRSAWVRSINKSTSCFEISEIQAIASFTPNVSFNETIFSCDDEFFVDDTGNKIDSDKDGKSSFNFLTTERNILDEVTTAQPSLNRADLEVLFFETEAERDATINNISDISNYRNSIIDNQTIYIKINNKINNDCQGIGEFPIQVNPLPEFTVLGESPEAPLLLCLNEISINLEVQNPFEDNYTYSWKDENGNEIATTENIDVFSGGNFTVTATIPETLCSRSRTIKVITSNIVPIDNQIITIIDNLRNPQEKNLSVEVDVTKIGLIPDQYLYALTRKNNTVVFDFQENSIFKNLEGGLYNIIIKNKDGCGISETVISIIEIPNFFTPNNDGRNDFFNVKGVNADFYSTADIRIFDRFGKLINVTSFNDLGWDGTFNGNTLPEDDYWYTITLIPIDNSIPPFKKTGHFSLVKE